MLRIVFRSVLVLTLAVLAILKASRTSISPAFLHAISYWMLFSAALAFVYLVYTVMLAVKDPRNRRLYIRDMMLAVIWLIFWVLSLGR